MCTLAAILKLISQKSETGSSDLAHTVVPRSFVVSPKPSSNFHIPPKKTLFFSFPLLHARSHKDELKPRYFLTHFRWAGSLQRGQGGKLALAKLPTILLRPQSRPPTESLRDVRMSKLLEKVPRGCTVHGDGARAWKSESKRLKLRFKNVVHYKMQFSKLVRVRRLPKLTGMQCLDQTWKQLKRYIPKELRSRDKMTTIAWKHMSGPLSSG